MATKIQCSINQPLRESLTWEQTWKDEDQGLIRCWERGRQMCEKDRELAIRASNGELIVLPWRGGVEEKLKLDLKKDGTLNYFAMWRGLRGDNLDIDLQGEYIVECSRTGQKVLFSNSGTAE